MERPRIVQELEMHPPYGLSGWQVLGLVQQTAGQAFGCRRSYYNHPQYQIGYRTDGGLFIHITPAMDKPGFSRNVIYHSLLVCIGDDGGLNSFFTPGAGQSIYRLLSEAVTDFSGRLLRAIEDAKVAKAWPPFVEPV